MTSSYSKIYQTRDFGIFKFFDENREIKTKHLKNIQNSIQRENRISQNPIIVTPVEGKLFILDGQHRFNACKALNIPVFYTINENPSEYCMIDDQIAKPWTLEDFLHYYVVKGFPEYLKVKSLTEKFEVPFGSIFSLLGSSKSGSSKLVRSGKMKLDEKLESFVEESYDFRKYVIDTYNAEESRKVIYRKDFLLALYWFHRTFKDKSLSLFNILKKCFHDIPTKCTRRGYEEIFIKKYNTGKVSGRAIRHPESRA